MSGSVVFYRFKAQKDPSTIHFEGTGISVWDLKKDILAENKLGKGADFDFAIYNADTNDEYSDDKAIIPRSTSVIARRLPPSKPGRGNAQYYMVSNSAAPQAGPSSSSPGPNGTGRGAGPSAARGHVTRRFDGKETSPLKPSSSTLQPVIATTASTGADEAARIAAMLATTSEQWKDTQEQMSTATPVFYGNRRPGAGGPRPPHANLGPEKPVPPGYVCYRCGQPGHWIQDCPTNDKPEWENKPRIKRTTGIPKSFLQTVEGPGKDGENQAGMMITADGSFVVARPDAASWDKHRAVQANLTSSDIQNSAPTDPDLVCPLCSRLLRDAVKTGCCGTTYCEECIHNYLSENDFVCPECESKIKSLKNLTKDEDRRERAKKYLEDTLKASKATAEAQTKENGSDVGDSVSAGEGALSAMANSSARDGKGKEGTPTGPPEEGELGRDGQPAGKGRSQSPRSVRAGSIARSDAGSVGNGSKAGSQGHGNGSGAQGANSNGSSSNVDGSGNGGMMQSNMNQMNTMFNNFNNNFGNSMPPQLQMVQNQLQQTMNILSSPSLPPQMRMQLLGQLQGLQYQYAQLTQMMGAGAFGVGGPGMQQQVMMAQRMQQMQHMQQMMMLQQQQQMYNAQNGNGMMQQNGFHGNGAGLWQQQQQQGGALQQQRNRPQPGVQYEEDSADSPYMRVPVNPKFKQGLKRERPEDFVEIGNQPIRRM